MPWLLALEIERRAPVLLFSVTADRIPIPDSWEPSPINEVAVTEPVAVVFPLNSTLKASDLLELPVPFPITKAVFAVSNSVALDVTEEPLELYCPITKETKSLAVALFPIAVE